VTGVCYVHQVPHEGHHDSAVEHKFITLSQLGVVKPGPPRLTAFNITGNLKVRSHCVRWVLCCVKYLYWAEAPGRGEGVIRQCCALMYSDCNR
jgi:hypothetical protein